MGWISAHASEILVAIITVIITKAADYLLAKRARLFFFYTHGAQFNIPNQNPGQPPITPRTITLALWNNGRAVAERVRIVHTHLPPNYQIWPPLQATVNHLPSGHVELLLPQILPNQIVFVSYLDFIFPLDTNMIVQIEAADHKASPMQFQFTKMFPRWVNLTLQTLVVLGIVVVVRYAYLLGVALLHLLR